MYNFILYYYIVYCIIIMLCYTYVYLKHFWETNFSEKKNYNLIQTWKNHNWVFLPRWKIIQICFNVFILLKKIFNDNNFQKRIFVLKLVNRFSFPWFDALYIILPPLLYVHINDILIYKCRNSFHGRLNLDVFTHYYRIRCECFYV